MSVAGGPCGFRTGVVKADNVNFSGDPGVPGGQVTSDGQLLIGATAFPNIRPGLLTSTGGSVTITVGPGTINLESAASASTWVDSAGGALAIGTNYFATAAAAYTLPSGTANGDMIEIVDTVGGGVVVTAQGGDFIQISNVASSANGTATSTQKGDSLRLVFRLVDLTWYQAPGVAGIWVLA
jgi:hypothetical protein